MCVCLTLQVVIRYTVGASVFWAEELARYSMVWIVYLLLFRWASQRGIMPLSGAGGIIEVVLMGVTVLLTVLSGVNYVLRNREIFSGGC
jgi:hypothetical protein